MHQFVASSKQVASILHGFRVQNPATNSNLSKQSTKMIPKEVGPVCVCYTVSSTTEQYHSAGHI
jgi:hypothetical protein